MGWQILRFVQNGITAFCNNDKDGDNRYYYIGYDCTDQEYMENFARRYGELHGVSVATDTPEHFLTDLQAAGYVR